MSSVIRFEPGQRWRHRNVVLLFRQVLPGGGLIFQEERTLQPYQIEDGPSFRVPDNGWALSAYASGDLKRLPEKHASATRRLAAEREDDPATIEALDAGARLRTFVLRGLDELGLFNASAKQIDRALRKLWAERPAAILELGRPPAPRTVMRWLKARGEPGQRPLNQMMSMTGKVPRAKRLPAEVHRLLDRFALRYWTSMGLSKRDAHALMALRIYRLNRWRAKAGIGIILRVPTYEWFRRHVNRLECRETRATKFGVKPAARRLKADGDGLSASRFLELGCMDHTMLDGIAVMSSDWLLPMGSPWLTLLIDVKTRCVVGFVLSFEPPSIYSVMECIKRAALPKTHLLERTDRFAEFASIFGMFSEIVVDNGREFAGVAFEDAMLDVGVSLRLAPVASPQHKAIVERFFGTLNSLLNRKLPAAKLKPQDMRDMGYEPEAHAILTLEEIETLLWEAINVYHLSNHSGVAAPPGMLWKDDAAKFGIPVYFDPYFLEKALGAVKEGCRLSRSGVQIHGLRYHDEMGTGRLLSTLVPDEPQRRQRKVGSATCQVKVKFNPADIGSVHVWDHINNQYVTLPCTDLAYAKGLPLAIHRNLTKWAKERGLAFSSEQERISARGELVRKVEVLAPDLRLRQRRSVARLINTPTVQDRLSGAVEVAFAQSRHDGMAPLIEQQPLALSRSDEGIAPRRPPRPKSKAKPPAKPRPAAAQTDQDVWPVESRTSASWKGFQ